jgi:hypothetical protein
MSTNPTCPSSANDACLTLPLHLRCCRALHRPSASTRASLPPSKHLLAAVFCPLAVALSHGESSPCPTLPEHSKSSPSAHAVGPEPLEPPCRWWEPRRHGHPGHGDHRPRMPASRRVTRPVLPVHGPNSGRTLFLRLLISKFPF